MDILELIDRAESLVAKASRVPLTRRRIVESESLLDVLDQMRAALPEDVKEGADLLAQRDAIIGHSLAEAKGLIATAEQDARARVRQHTVTREAEERATLTVSEAGRRASNILALAEREASARRSDVNSYSLTMMRELETKLEESLMTIRRGYEALQRISEALPQAS